MSAPRQSETLRVFHCARFTLPLPAGHRFPMDKYRLLYERVMNRSSGLTIAEAPAASLAALGAVHDPDYVQQICAGTLAERLQRKIGLPWSAALVERARRAAGATLAACDSALEAGGVAVNLSGGTHHAGRARGAGFCVFNDVAIAATQALYSGRASEVAIIDCDVHQGDGTAELLAGRPGYYTFSIHAARNYPHRKISGDCDIALADGTGDEAYLDALRLGLEHVFDVTRPELVIYIAGADVYAGDRLGRLALSKAGIAARDKLVCAAAAQAGAALAVVMGGGYADDLATIVDIHEQTVRIAADSHASRRCGQNSP